MTSRPEDGPPPGAPGAPDAIDSGCTCLSLANAGYRAGAETEPLIAPDCPLHAAPPVER